MTNHDREDRSEESASKTGIRRTRPWVAAGVALGLVTGVGASLAATMPFAVGATTETTVEEGQDRMDEGNDDRHELGSKSEHGFGHRDHHGHRGHRGVLGLRGDLVKSAAELLGLTVEELREELRSGSTLAEIAQENGTSRQELIDGLTTTAIESMTEKINEMIPRLVDGEIGPRRDS